jgi:hypothetical protein
MKLIKQNCGNSFILAINGTKEEIEQKYNSWYNFCATNSFDLFYLSDNFAYVWSTPEKFKNYLYVSSWHEIADEEKITRDSEYLREKARKRALQKEEMYHNEMVVNFKEVVSYQTYKIHEITES